MTRRSLGEGGSWFGRRQTEYALNSIGFLGREMSENDHEHKNSQ